MIFWLVSILISALFVLLIRRAINSKNSGETRVYVDEHQSSFDKQPIEMFVENSDNITSDSALLEEEITTEKLKD